MKYTKEQLNKAAWKIHQSKIEHGGGCHLFENGGRGPTCTGPYPSDIKEAEKFLSEL